MVPLAHWNHYSHYNILHQLYFLETLQGHPYVEHIVVIEENLSLEHLKEHKFPGHKIFVAKTHFVR